MEITVYKYLSDLEKSGELDNIKTPIYVYFPQELEKNIKAFSKLKDNGIKLFFALKSNNYKSLVYELIKNGIGFDVASKEEIQYALSLGAKVENLTFSAPSKRPEDILYAAKKGVKYYAFDSEIEIQKVHKADPEAILFARMAAFNQEAVFNLSSKFGMSEDYCKYILKSAKKKGWNIQGLTFHVGSQNTSSESWRKEMKKMEGLIGYAKENGLQIKYLNLGGGIPAQYDKNIPSAPFYIDRILLFCETFKKNNPDIEIFIEPGRAMSANTMILLTRVIDIKPYKKPPIAIVDTGVFNGIIEPLEHFEYPIALNHFGECEKGYYRIAGFSCEGYDVIKHKVLLPKNLKVGDLIPIMYAGAYTFVYKKFHMVDFPPIQELVK